jgi:hypothetical protein
MFHLMMGGLASLQWLRRHAPAPVEQEDEFEEIEIEATPIHAAATNRR